MRNIRNNTVMANFTSEIKRDILSDLPTEPCCGKAALSALLLTSGTVDREKIEFVSENEKIAEYFLRLTEDLFSVRPEVKGAVFDPKHERDKLTFSYRGEKRSEILRETGLSEGGLERVTAKDCCAVSFIQSAFLGSGSCTLPHGGAKTGYHLEFILPDQTVAEEFCDLLARFELLARVIVRGEKSVVYLKSGEAICDFFSVIGAQTALKKLENVTAARAESNNENRVSNCFAGNADKAAIASAQQVIALERLQKSGKLSSLARPLQDVARARLTYPSYSLGELAASLGVSKSCLNHRMRKLLEIYRTENNHD